jgi:hypothetical protein
MPPPGTILLEYRLQPPQPLTIAWTTSSASGRLSRPLTPEDLAAIQSLRLAVSTPGSDWQPLAARAADLLLSGIEPLDGVRRVIVSAPDEALRGVPFEVLGTPALIRRFTVWYEPSAAFALHRLWPAPPEFPLRYERELATGLPAAEALRRAKIQELHRHPYYWAGFVLHGDGMRIRGPVIPWVWMSGSGLLLASAAFLVWWRRRRFELW